MHITELILYSVPPLEVVEVNCDERVNVFIGPNACGKSTILRAIEYIYYSPQQDHPLSTMAFPNSKWPDEWNYEDNEDLDDAPLWVSKNSPFCWVIASEDWPHYNPSPIDGARAYREPIWHRVPLLYMPATRVNLTLDLPDDWLEGRPDRLIENNSHEPSFAHAFGLFDADPTVFNGDHVKQVADKLRLNRRSRSLEERDKLNRALQIGYSCAKRICMEVIHDEGVHPYVDEAGVAHPGMGIGTSDITDGASLYLGDLSSGTQGTLSWIWALCLKMARHYGWKNGWENEPGILLIDEIENHLHPTWQRRVIPTLLDHFPKLQIFATTHSPFVVAGLKTGQAHLVHRSPGRFASVDTNTENIVGWTADEILRTFMGVEDPTDEMTATNAARLRVLRRKDALEGLDDDEQAELDVLRTKAGADILAQGGMLNAQRERFADMVQDFLKARLTDTPPDEA